MENDKFNFWTFFILISEIVARNIALTSLLYIQLKNKNCAHMLCQQK